MTAFRLVAAEQAGPTALGILVPPSRRTVLIVRPRGLPFDLLVVHSDRQSGPTTKFREFGREEGSAAAEGLYAALRRWAEDVAVGKVSLERAAEGWLLRVQIEVYPLLACARQAGKPYQPLVFSAQADVEEAAVCAAGVLRPAPDAGQEVYFNDRHFSRP